MPTKVKVLIGWMFLAMLGLGFDALANNSTQSLILMLYTCGLFVGIIKGSEGIRTMLVVGGTMGIAAGAMSLVQIGMLTDYQIKALGNAYVFAWVIGVVGLLQNLLFVWCLTRIDVQEWMFKRSTGLA